MLRLITAIVMTVGMAGMLTAEETSDKPLQEWSGKIAQPELRKVAPKAGFIKDAETFKKIWTVWRPGEEVPEINFDEKLVVFGTVDGPNLVIMKPSLKDQGDLRFVVGGTRIGGPGFGYKLMVVDRKGVRSVNGNGIDETPAEESIKVTVVGKLKTGIVAIGGETTGATITANSITWELDFGGNEKLRSKAESLSGQQVLVRGSLERTDGVEIKERWIVTVRRLQAAE